MWQVAVLTRFEALQAFLSSNECENIKFALFDQHTANTRVNAETIQESTMAISHKAYTSITMGGSDSVSSRAKWKLDGAMIDKLTSAGNTKAGITLNFLETRLANLRFFARGKRGVLYAGELRLNNTPVVVKLAVDATFVASVTVEARWLRVVNRMGIGAKLIDAADGWFLCERLEGKNVVEFLDQSNKVVTPANAVWAVREMLHVFPFE
ncbi:unnamed protein product [Peronospora belbahrii]|uniref:Uncharacterized protein n=1 Tax=Peronospora belbahrii TaxID=622444 RepID=A0AAU9KK65_9STRA|nr:unnamed protein product [Peronospora belbahrii]